MTHINKKSLVLLLGNRWMRIIVIKSMRAFRKIILFVYYHTKLITFFHVMKSYRSREESCSFDN